MQIIAMTSERLPEVAAWLAQYGDDPTMTVDWLRRRTLDDPTCAPEHLLLAEEAGTLVGACFGCAREAMGVVKLLLVHPDFRRRGIGMALMDALEERFRAQGLTRAVAGGVPPNYFWPGIDLRHAELLALLWQRGYQTNRVALVNLTVDLTRTPLDVSAECARLAGEGFELRRATAAEGAPIAEMARELVPVWDIEVREAAQNHPPTLFVAWQAGQVAAFAACDVSGYGRFGPTGTRPDLRRRGLGGALMRLCFADMAARGQTSGEITWAGPVDYYIRAVDARVVRAMWVFAKELTEQGQRDGQK